MIVYLRTAIFSFLITTACNSLPKNNISKEARERHIEVPIDTDIPVDVHFDPPTRATVKDCSFHHNGMYYYEDPTYKNHFIYKKDNLYIEIDRSRNLKLIGELHHYDDCSYAIRYTVADNLENAIDVVGTQYTYYILESTSQYYVVSLSTDGTSKKMKLIRYHPDHKN